MTLYRAYPMKGPHVDGVPHILDARDDQDAIRQASALLSTADLEIWDRARMVARVTAKDAAVD